MTGNVVFQDQVVWTKNYGLKDKNNRRDPPNQDTVFRVASITKIFTVSAISFRACDKRIFNHFLSLISWRGPVTSFSLSHALVMKLHVSEKPSPRGRYVTR